jgi:hypothetical protein
VTYDGEKKTQRTRPLCMPSVRWVT